MHSRNDAPHHHNSGDGCGVEGRYVPFSSSGGARPLPYPFGLCGKVRLHHEKKEKVGVAEEATPPPVIAILSRQNDSLSRSLHNVNVGNGGDGAQEDATGVNLLTSLWKFLGIQRPSCH